ncbi:PREDICTED: uncharacterized protein LOC107345364 [Acropora digitifera]|uniref:uncharacterized protein LOC107345364 n=1 Tax=Acropora digitifera TaxID=70779 RepID=UPI00077B1756|nr:PREDICTED: uncharacterized protein LOC107345364 [Acropora digitifera]
MTFPSSLFKTIPTGKPNLVQPTLNKIDVEALKRDLKKFEENYPVGVSRAWARWLQDIDKLLELPNHWEWPLDILQRCSRVPRLVNEDISIPNHLQAMRDKETVETQQIYTGRYRPTRERENLVQAVDDCLENIEVGKFVAVHLANYDRVPVIGKVLEVNGDSIKIHYWKGSFKGKWSPQDVPRRRTPWVDELPKTCIILCSFSLTEDSKLLPSTRRHLQDEYARLKQNE